jgi:hypothetical protein
MATSRFPFLHRFLSRSAAPRRPVRRRPHSPPRVRPLEDRALPSTFAVTNLLDSGPGSLRDEIQQANMNPGADTVVFKHGLNGTIPLTSGELLITDSVTINGLGADKISVSGGGTSRVLEVAASLDVSVSGLTITDGYAPDQGGGILNDGSNLTLSADDLTQNVVVESATNYGLGGAIQSLGGALTVTDCQITGNQALGAVTPGFGGGLGGGINIPAGTATISGCTISDNLAQGAENAIANGQGGGINTEAGVPIVITNCIVSDNRAVAGNNSTGAGGGAGLALGASATIADTIFSGNVAVGSNGGVSAFVGEAEGGAIWLSGANFGGGPGTTTISGSTFINNMAVGGSGGNSGPGAADPGLDESYGAGIFNLGGTIDVSNTTFSHNTSLGGSNGTATGTDIVEVGVAEGGAICNEIGATATLSNCAFDDNQAIGGSGNTGSGPVVHCGTGFGAGIFSGFGGPSSFVGANGLAVSNTTFQGNTAQGGDNNSGTASVEAEVGVGVGGGIMNDLGGTATVSGSELDHNKARGGTGNAAGGTGAAFANLGAGAGIFNDLGNYNSSGYGPFSASIVTVSGCTIDHNFAQGGGGGNGEGGGIADVLSATTAVDSSALTKNQANGDGGGVGLGGGAYNDATSSLALTASLVTGNHANGSPGIGGGVYNLGTFSFDVLTVIDRNHASTSNDNVGP